MAGLVDWGLARNVAARISGEGATAASSIDPSRASRTCDEALARVLAYTGLEPIEPAPRLELIGRREWVGASLATLEEMAEPLERAAAESVQLPGLLGSAARRALGAAAGVEAGVISGYASSKVLGQFDIALTARPRPSRLLLVEPNVVATAKELDVDLEPFLLWIAVHEQTHAAQFTAVPWLREHLAALLGELLEASGAGLDPKAIARLAKRLLRSDPRESLRAALRGELMQALAGPKQQALFDRLQATMAVVEGYAEHVMDAAVAGEPGMAELRARLEKRRAERGGLANAIARALGLGMKMRQYELGKSFCDEVVAERGIESLNEVWSEPDALPDLGQLESPSSWLSAAPAA